MVNPGRIRQLYERYKKRSNKYMEDYQQSGIAQLYAEYHRAEELADVCERALSTADDHADAVYWKTQMVTLGNMAFDAVHRNNLDDYRDVVKAIIRVVEQNNLVKDKWK